MGFNVICMIALINDINIKCGLSTAVWAKKNHTVAPHISMHCLSGCDISFVSRSSSSKKSLTYTAKSNIIYKPLSYDLSTSGGHVIGSPSVTISRSWCLISHRNNEHTVLHWLSIGNIENDGVRWIYKINLWSVARSKKKFVHHLNDVIEPMQMYSKSMINHNTLTKCTIRIIPCGITTVK